MDNAYGLQITALLRGGLCAETVTLHTAVDVQALTDVAVRQGIVAPLFCGLLGAGFAAARI